MRFVGRVRRCRGERPKRPAPSAQRSKAYVYRAPDSGPRALSTFAAGPSPVTRHSSPRRNGAHGFTLVELLVAIAVLALLSVAATTLLGTTLDNQAELRQRGEKLQSLGMALAIMRRDLEQIAPRPGRDERGDPYSEILVTYREEEPELLQFIHLGRRQLPGSFRGSSLERVTYRLQEEKLQRLTAPVADPVGGTPWRERTLMEGVTDIRLEFYDGERWHGEWPPLEGESGQLPLAVSVVLDTELWRGVRIDVLTAGGRDDERQP